MSIALILQVIAALPKLIGMLIDLINSFKDYQTDSRVNKAQNALKELESAKTKEDRDKAAQVIINNGPI